MGKEEMSENRAKREAVEFALKSFADYENDDVGRRDHLRQNFEKNPELRTFVDFSKEQLMDALIELVKRANSSVAQGGAGLENLTQAVKAAMDARDAANLAEKTVVISRATGITVKRLYSNAGICDFLEGEVEAPRTDIHFTPFQWNGRSEDDGIADAKEHIEKELCRFDVKVGAGGYKVVDVHLFKNLLDVDDDKIGKISGGTGVIVVPNRCAREGYACQGSVIWEVKSEEAVRMEPEKLEAFVAEGWAELLALRCNSAQPGVLVVLTDLVSGAILLEIEFDGERFFGTRTSVDLDGMMAAVVEFLGEKSVPDVRFRPSKGNPRDAGVIAFKKTRLSNDMGLAWEHFNNFVGETAPDSLERNALVKDLFRELDIPCPTVLALPHILAQIEAVENNESSSV